MAHGSGDFITGEDLEDVYFLLEGGFLDDDESIASDINIIATEVSSDEEIKVYQCDKCDQICKSKRGLTRHINVKHKEDNSLQDASQNVLPATTTTSDATSIEDERIF